MSAKEPSFRTPPQVGDQVWVWWCGTWIVRTISKITPSGLIDVQIGDSEDKTYRFKANGRAHGSHYDSNYIDMEMSFEERAIDIERERKTLEAMRLIRSVNGDAYRYSTKDEMLKELDRLSDQIAEARSLVKAI